MKLGVNLTKNNIKIFDSIGMTAPAPNSLPQQSFIKNVKVQYLHCPKAGLHEGEILSFICIDAACPSKGLICPICLNQEHAAHQTMHLKLFLHEIHGNIYDKSGENSLGCLADYLQSLESSKKEMLKSLKEMVVQLSEKVREVEQKIESSYMALRKTVLSQVQPRQ